MDWVVFLTDHDIPYVTRGSNVRRDNLAVKCPYCGEDDPSEHLSISLIKDAWGCWRDPTHRGRAAHRLIQALLGCSYGEAKQLAVAYSAPNPEGDLAGAIVALTLTSDRPSPVAGYTGHLALPAGYRPIKNQGSTAKHWQYLANRHFDDVDDLVSRYQLGCCLTGQWKDRVLIPFYQNGELVGWTGRAIQPVRAAPRYLSSSDAVKRTVFGEDSLMEGGRILFIVEGPFDALKVDYYGEPDKVRATCVFGVTMTIDQICILSTLRKRFKKVVLLFDQDTVGPTFFAADWLQAPNVAIGTLPEGVKDPGALWPSEVEQLIGGYL